jgi:hypothetical protein
MAAENTSDKNAGLTPRAREVAEKIRSNPELMAQIQASEEYFDQGGPGIPWEEVVARTRAKRGQPPL